MPARRQKQATHGEEKRDVFVLGLICHRDERLGRRKCQTTGDGAEATETFAHEEGEDRGHAQHDAGYRQDVGGNQRPIERRECRALHHCGELSECDRTAHAARES